MYGNGYGSTNAAPPMGWAPSLGGEATAVIPQPATERIHVELEGAIKRVHQAIDRVVGFANAHLGERGALSAPGKDQPSRSGRIGAIQDRVDQLHASLSVLETELERLTQI